MLLTSRTVRCVLCIRRNNPTTVRILVTRKIGEKLCTPFVEIIKILLEELLRILFRIVENII